MSCDKKPFKGEEYISMRLFAQCSRKKGHKGRCAMKYKIEWSGEDV